MLLESSIMLLENIIIQASLMMIIIYDRHSDDSSGVIYAPKVIRMMTLEPMLKKILR
jgi:hypothetical protein